MAVLGFAKRILDGEALAVFGGGALERDFTYVDDTVAALQALVEHHDHPLTGADVVNVGHAQPVTVDALIQGLERALGASARRVPAPTPPGDVTRTCADETHLRQLIETWPQTRLDDGLARVAAWLDRWKHLI
jgi:UDP-glucuronate 4-epimerase